MEKCGLNLNRNQKELKPHGTLDFPCAGFDSRYTDSDEDIIPWHWHEEMELVYVKEGEMKLQIPGRTIVLKQGEGFAINSNILHFGAATTCLQLHSLVFHPLLITGSRDSVFAAKYLTPLLTSPAFDGCLFHDAGLGKDICVKNFVEAFEAFSSGFPGFEFLVREKLSNICMALWKRYEQELGDREGEFGQDNLRIRRMLDFIHLHYSDSLSLSQIAESANVGERECLRCFKRVIKVSPVQYLLKYRVMQGADMLLHNWNSSISEISSVCGFDSPSNFSQMFKRFYKYTPKEYREKNQVK